MMLSQLRAECRKLLTVRSTYVVWVFMVGFMFLFSYLINGLNVYIPPSLTNVATQTSVYRDSATSALQATAAVGALLSAIVGILFIVHEYRYSTIAYAFTATRRRSQVGLAKLLVLIGYVLLNISILLPISAVLAWIGFNMGHAVHVSLYIPPLHVFWQCGVYFMLYTLLGLGIGLLLRHVVGAISLLFVSPIVESFFYMLLKENSKYLPFHAANNIVTTADTWGFKSATTAALVFFGYVAALLVIAWILFVRRDAN